MGGIFSSTKERKTEDILPSTLNDLTKKAFNTEDFYKALDNFFKNIQIQSDAKEELREHWSTIDISDYNRKVLDTLKKYENGIIDKKNIEFEGKEFEEEHNKIVNKIIKEKEKKENKNVVSDGFVY